MDAASSTLLSAHVLGDMVLQYHRRGDAVGWLVVPSGRTDPAVSWSEPLVQLALRGDAASGGFAAGHTLRGSQSVAQLRFVEQTVDARPDGQTITTVLALGEARVRHVVEHGGARRSFRVRTEVVAGAAPLTFDLLSSFTLGGLSPLSGGLSPGSLVIHQARSTWSQEGRLVSTPVEDLQLEPSWSQHGVRVERFGQVGSLPVRKYFPFVAVEDRLNGVVWAVQLACPSSWQLELARRDATLAVSGGWADFELGHWSKTVEPGETLVTPWALVTVAEGGVDEASQRLLDEYPASQRGGQRLPMVFNEFCASWGRPTYASVASQVACLTGHDVDTYVIDAGWYADADGGWEHNHGDWSVAEHLFPSGLAAAVDTIHRAGLKAGLWFELETCGPRSRAYGELDHLLQRHGRVITSGTRRFWNMTDPWVNRYLAERVVARLRDDGFDYLKLDYNESLGVGCDGGESLGEGLRTQILATQRFLQQLRHDLPHLEIESCASGGHRLEASMVSLTDYSSFSDAHECLEIPVLAANLHRLVPPRQTQIWAVLRPDDAPQRLVYSLASTFLGLPCLSGDVEALGDEAWRWVDRAIGFHRGIAPLLCAGTTSFHGPRQKAYRQLEGWQAVVREGADHDQLLVVLHTFANPPDAFTLPLPWPAEVADLYCAHSPLLELMPHQLRLGSLPPFAALGLRLVRR